MADLISPRELVDRGSTLLQLLGSFWNSLYGGWQQLASFGNARNQSEIQTYRDISELIACTSRFDVPIYHRKNWSTLTIRESDKLAGRLLRYGDPDLVFGNNASNYGVIYSYGVSPNTEYEYNNANRFADCSVIMNRLTAPSLVWTKAIDFLIDPDTKSISFREDPFSQSVIPTRPVYDGSGSVIDKELTLWMFMADYDWSFIYEQFGYSLNVYIAESSENYRLLINAIWDAIVVGSSHANLQTLLACLTDTPITIEPYELVEDIYSTPQEQLVITDLHVYHLTLDASITVEIGQTLSVGTPLCDAFTIYYPDKDLPDSTKVPAISIAEGFLLTPFTSGLTFENKTVDLDITTDLDGRTRVEFEIGGVYPDIQSFWDTVHSNGTAEDATSLAQLLDLRYPPVQSEDPTAVNLPLTINPMDFLLKNVLRCNALLVHLNINSLGPEALGLSNPYLFRLIIPPQNTLLIFSQLTLSGTDDQIELDIDETLTIEFMAPDVLSESSPHSYFGSETITVTTIPE